MDKLSALATALAVMAMPDMALWSRQVQPDVPTVALLLATAWVLIGYLQSSRSRWLIATAVHGTGDADVYAGRVCGAGSGLACAVHRTPQRPSLRVWAGATCLFLALALPSVASVIYFSRVTGNLAGAMPGMPALWTVDNWTWYARQPADQISTPVVFLLVAGLVCAAITVIRSGASIHPYESGCRVCAVIVDFFTVVSNKEPRFNYPAFRFSSGAPSNAFGGYRTTFPNGRIDGDVSCQASAIREAYEEAGLKVRITKYFADSNRSQSYTRYYLARRVGGNLASMGRESQAVHLVPRARLADFLTHPNDLPLLAALLG